MNLILLVNLMYKSNQSWLSNFKLWIKILIKQQPPLPRNLTTVAGKYFMYRQVIHPFISSRVKIFSSKVKWSKSKSNIKLK